MKTPVLMYHHVYDPADGNGEGLSPPPLHPSSYLSRQEFSRHLDLIRHLGFETLTLAEALQADLEGPPRPRPRRVVLTFDDGCSCFTRHALPELHERGMRATVFAVSGELGGHNRWDSAAGERRESLASVRELRELVACGMEVASHSHSHPDLTTLTAPRLECEILGSRQVLEDHLGVAVLTFCYPYGNLDPGVREKVAESGYRGAVSIHGKPFSDFDHPLAVPRMIVRPAESRFELGLKVRGLYPLWSRLPRLGLLAALRRRGDRSP